MKRAALGFLLTLAIAGVVGADELIPLKRVAKEGDELNYAFNLNFDVAGMTGVFKADAKEKVSAVKGSLPDKVDYTMTNGVVQVSGQEQEQDLDSYTASLDETGKVKSITGALQGVEGIRFARMQHMTYPTEGVKVGSKWTAKYDADATAGTPEQVNEYEVKAITEKDGVKTIEVAFKHEEKGGDAPATCTGTYTARGTDGVLVDLKFSFTNLVVAGYTISGEATRKLKS